jgi:hypothetical protein
VFGPVGTASKSFSPPGRRSLLFSEIDFDSWALLRLSNLYTVSTFPAAVRRVYVQFYSQMRTLRYTYEDQDCDHNLKCPEVDEGALEGHEQLWLRIAHDALLGL